METKGMPYEVRRENFLSVNGSRIYLKENREMIVSGKYSPEEVDKAIRGAMIIGTCNTLAVIAVGTGLTALYANGSQILNTVMRGLESLF